MWTLLIIVALIWGVPIILALLSALACLLAPGCRTVVHRHLFGATDAPLARPWPTEEPQR